jgi:predicted amidohydrolase
VADSRVRDPGSRFVEQAAVAIRSLARGVPDPDRDYAGVALAAQIYATAVYLFEHYKTPEMELPARELLDGGFGAALRAAVRMQAAPIASFHAQLRTLLFTLAGSYRPAEERRTFPARTLLRSVRDPDREQTAIEGEVLHWLRPRSAWRRLRDHRNEESGHRLNEQPPNLVQDLEPLAMHWNHAPPIVARVDPSDDVLHELIDLGHARMPSLKIALCPLASGTRPRFRTDTTGRFFHIDRGRPIWNPAHLRDHLAEVLAESAQRRIDIVVLPELCIDPAARGALAKQVKALSRANHRFLAVIAGSFHIWRKRRAAKPINEAVVLGPRGISQWNHVKHGTFTMRRDQVIGAKGTFFPDDQAEDLAEMLIEYVENGRELLVCDSRIGRLAMAICADVLQPGSRAEALKTWIRPDLLFVVSMSSNTQVFLHEGRSDAPLPREHVLRERALRVQGEPEARYRPRRTGEGTTRSGVCLARRPRAFGIAADAAGAVLVGYTPALLRPRAQGLAAPAGGPRRGYAPVGRAGDRPRRALRVAAAPVAAAPGVTDQS